MTAATRSARGVTTLIRRLQDPRPTREYEHKQRLLAHVEAHGSLRAKDACRVLGLAASTNGGRLLGELVDEGLLDRASVADAGGYRAFVPVVAR